MPPHKILISGAGIAGSVTAYWLGRAGFDVTVLERTPALRTAGQGIDMEGPAVSIIRKLGFEQTIRSKATGEKGVAFVDENNVPFATFDVGEKKTDIGSRLCEEIYSSVWIATSSGTEESYDMVIAADGFRSRTRQLILENTDTEAFIQIQNCWVAYFSIPREPQDQPRSRGYNAVGGRFIMIRPQDDKLSSGYLVVSKDEPSLRKVQRAGMAAQKAALAELFADAGWEATRVIEGVCTTNEFWGVDDSWLVYWSGITRWIGCYKMPEFDLPDYDFDRKPE
ncbi:FAD/NAD(P)-binding domain-containing protein, partial [Aureobasidium melanogenum]